GGQGDDESQKHPVYVSRQFFTRDLGRKSLLNRKGGYCDSGAREQVMVVKELRDAVKESMTLAPGLNDLVRSEALAFLDIPDDIGVDAVAFAGEQVTAHVSEQQGAQHLKAVNRAGEIRRLLVYRAAHFDEPLCGGSTNPRDFRIDVAQSEVSAECN